MSRGVRPSLDDHVKREDVAFLFPFFGIVVLVPPIVNLFVVERLVFGMPLEVVYLFTVWVALILGAIILARRPPFQANKPDMRPESNKTRQERVSRDM